MKQRKDGRWVKAVTIDRNRVYFYSAATTEKKAEKDIQQQLLDYKEKEEQGKTLLFVSEEWQKEHYPTLQHQTAERYNSHVARFNAYFNGRYIKEIKSIDIEHFYNSMVIDQFSTKTIKDQAGIVKMIMKYAMIRQYITTDPAIYVTPPKGKPKNERLPLTAEDVSRVKTDIFSQFGQIAYFLLYTGMRKGELLALTYGDIDLKNSLISVDKSLEYMGNSPHVKTPKTSAGVRKIPLPDVLKPIVSGKHKDTDIIFAEKDGYMHKSYFRENWIKHCAKIGIDVTPHQFRHTYATFLYEWEISAKDAQQILGHADITTTQNIYTHISTTRMIETSKIINKKIKCGT